MNKEDIIDCIFKKIIAIGFDVNRSPLTHKVFILVYSAQGIIDNGGFEYFFESPFEGSPDYQEFVEAFIQIGAIKCAEAIKKAIKLSELGDNSKFSKLDRILFENSEENYNKLRIYAENNFVPLYGLTNLD